MPEARGENAVSEAAEDCQDDVNWLECISAIETPKGLIYFCDREYGEKNEELTVLADFAQCLPGDVACLYSITAYNPHNKVCDKVKNEMMNSKLKDDLRSSFPDCPLYNNFSFFPGRPYHFERGYTVIISRGYSRTDHGRVIHDLALRYEQAAFFKCAEGSDGLMAPYVVLVQGDYSEIQEKLTAIRKVALHPAFLHEDNNALSDSLEDALKVMKGCVDIPYVSELLGLFEQHCHAYTEPEEARPDRRPFLVVEGYNAAECAASIATAVGAEYCPWLPQSVRHLYPKFQNSSTHLMAAFRILVNYLQAALVRHKTKTTCVVMDRYWHDTLASVIVAEVGIGSGNLPPKEHEVYDTWPAGLLQPDVVVWLRNGGGKKSCARRPPLELSDRVNQDSCLPLKTTLAHETFRRMQDASWIVVPGGTGDEVALRVVDELQRRNLIDLHRSSSGCPSGSPAPLPPVHDALARRTLATNVYGRPPGEPEKPFWF